MRRNRLPKRGSAKYSSTRFERKIEPGSFYLESASQLEQATFNSQAASQQESASFELEGGEDNDSFVVALRELRDILSVLENVKVAHSGSGRHTGVAQVFGLENVIHVDPDQATCRLLSDAGYLAQATRIEDFCPSELLDGIVALNSYGEPTKQALSKIVKPGGFIIVNNWTHWAARLAAMPGMELTTAILENYYSEDRQILEGADIPDNATELRALDPDGAHHYALYPDGLFVFKLAR